MKYDSVRIFADICNIACILSSVCIIIIQNTKYDKVQMSILFDFLFCGIFTATIQLCDNYMFYNRFVAVSKPPQWKKNIIHCYIIVALTLSWLPNYTVIPFIYNTNSPHYNQYYTNVLFFQFISTFVYNLYFTFQFGRILYESHYRIRPYSANTKLIAIKSIVHFFTRLVFYKHFNSINVQSIFIFQFGQYNCVCVSSQLCKFLIELFIEICKILIMINLILGSINILYNYQLFHTLFI